LALENLCAQRSVSELILLFKELVPDYNPSSQILRSCLEHPSEKQYAPAGGVRLALVTAAVR
jgi:hypothetical protein